MDSSDDTVDDSRAEIGYDAKDKHSGQLAHRFVHNFHVHEGEKTRCASCGDEKVCLRCTHVGKKKCEICGIWVSRIANHRRIHTGERPYKCAQCLASFSRKNVLVQHLRRHTGEKPFLCEVCGMTFSQKTGLDFHQACIHSSAQNHHCDECDKSFKLRCQLMKHKRQIHTCVYTCRQCSETLPTRNAYTEHCLIHSSQGKRTDKEAEDVEDIVEGSSEESDDVKSEKIPE